MHRAPMVRLASCWTSHEFGRLVGKRGRACGTGLRRLTAGIWLQFQPEFFLCLVPRDERFPVITANGRVEFPGVFQIFDTFTKTGYFSGELLECGMAGSVRRLFNLGQPLHHCRGSFCARRSFGRSSSDTRRTLRAVPTPDYCDTNLLCEPSRPQNS